MGWTLEDDANNFTWRVGRKLGRTIYAQASDEPDDEDSLLGLMETEGIATAVVEAVNNSRARSGAVVLPKMPMDAEDFGRGVRWAGEFFSIAQHLDMGLDDGQQVILDGLVKRLDQLENEQLWQDDDDDVGAGG